MSTSPEDLGRPDAAPPGSQTDRDSTCRVDLDWGNSAGLYKTPGLNSQLPGEVGGLSALGCRFELLELPADMEKYTVADMNYILDYSLLPAQQTEKSAELRIQAGKPEGQRAVAAGPEAILGNVWIDNPAVIQRDQTCSTLPTTHFRRHSQRRTDLGCEKAGRRRAAAAELLPVRGIHMGHFHHVDLLDRH